MTSIPITIQYTISFDPYWITNVAISKEHNRVFFRRDSTDLRDWLLNNVSNGYNYSVEKYPHFIIEFDDETDAMLIYMHWS